MKADMWGKKFRDVCVTPIKKSGEICCLLQSFENAEIAKLLTSSASSITDPRFNMKLGQDYVDYLLKYRGIDGDIISMLIAYNAGPGNLQKWRKRIKGHENDPLLLIEMLPVKETRDYVEHVMSNYWVYSIRDGQMPQSLASLAKGKYHKYAAYGSDENQSIQLASN